MHWNGLYNVSFRNWIYTIFNSYNVTLLGQRYKNFCGLSALIRLVLYKQPVCQYALIYETTLLW